MNAHGLWFDSGRTCLDLLATGGPERLSGPAELHRWLLGAGLLPPGPARRPVPVDGGWPPRFRALRADLAPLVRAALPAPPPGSAPRPATPRLPAAALARVNTLALLAPPGLCAVRGADGALVRELRGADCGALLAAVARDAVELLTDPAERALLRACAGDGCTRLYLDASRGHRRLWCSSELCGNRERVARHRRRTLADRPA
ncbi:ABATE domain-containing protein [Streptomyces sp. NPDC097619]|uniref:CGNR zinc finger domain-containing protein n=1 Tax=Streptomyces sp. NPDC097619 TaxID=3157228 RepID=UPI00331BA3F8